MQLSELGKLLYEVYYSLLFAKVMRYSYILRVTKSPLSIYYELLE